MISDEQCAVGQLERLAKFIGEFAGETIATETAVSEAIRLLTIGVSQNV